VTSQSETDTTESVFGHTPVGAFGKVAIRVVVLPKRDKDKAAAGTATAVPLDAEEGELLPESGSTPLASYLETSKGGKQAIVFLVNGQRQDAMDNSFIIQQLGFKYLRNRMMIVVDVDGLTQEAIGRLMQGSRQGFFKGEVWDAMVQRLVATLKEDPDLLRLEEEAEEQVSELKAGDEKVKQTLDQLIDAHHQSGLHFSEGSGLPGVEGAGENLGIKTTTHEGVVSLLPPEEGAPADYPVLVSQPAGSIRLRPNEERDITIKALPSNTWPALSELTIEPDARVPELRVAQERLGDHASVKLHFRQPDGFDTDQYPVRATLRLTARFNGIKEPRRLELRVLVKPESPPAEPLLVDPPTWLKVSSREPIRIKLGGGDTHVRLRWDGLDSLASGPSPSWAFAARVLDRTEPQPVMNFSQPSGGRFSLLVSHRPEWAAGDTMTFEVVASGPSAAKLVAKFSAEVIQPEQPTDEAKAPRLVDSDVSTGAIRRPPYVLKYITSDDYDTVECWGGANWTDDDPGSFTDPTERAPLTLIINEDMAMLREYRRYLTKRNTESEVERRINKYTSHVAFHLYQMFQASKQADGDPDSADQRRRAEIQRVSATLIKLMEVSR
jgi:hypothetical protein